MESVEKKQRVKSKLPWKRFVVMLVLMLVGVLGIIFDGFSKQNTRWVLETFSHPKRSVIIYFAGILIGILHYYNIGRHTKEVRSSAMRLFAGLFTSVATAIGYSLIINSSMNFSIGVIYEVMFGKKFFVDITQVDYITIIIVTLFILSVAGYLLYKMALDSIRGIGHPLTDPIPVKKQTDSQQNDG